jgi:hypothetical protein
MAGFAGVDETLVTRMAPVDASTQTMSVKVPPVSIPMRRFGLFPVIDDAPPANNGTRPPASQRTNAGHESRHSQMSTSKPYYFMAS